MKDIIHWAIIVLLFVFVLMLQDINANMTHNEYDMIQSQLREITNKVTCIKDYVKQNHDPVVRVNEEDLLWLTKTIYFESRSESTLGRIAVGFVVMNRLKHSNYPDSIKGIVTQKNQFEWYNDGKPDRMNNSIAKEQCEEVARSILLQSIKYDPTDGATHFINVNSNKKPIWTSVYTKVNRIDNHVFYRGE